jgi:hypothetical protein
MEEILIGGGASNFWRVSLGQPDTVSRDGGWHADLDREGLGDGCFACTSRGVSSSSAAEAIAHSHSKERLALDWASAPPSDSARTRSGSGGLTREARAS